MREPSAAIALEASEERAEPREPSADVALTTSVDTAAAISDFAVAILFATVTEKLSSLPIAAASSPSVSSNPGAPPIRSVIF